MRMRTLSALAGMTFILIGLTYGREANTELEKIKGRIHSLNLLNGLEMDKGQMKLVLDSARRAEAIRSEEANRLKAKEKELLAACSDVLKVAETGSLLIPQEVAARFRGAEKEADGIRKETQERVAALTAKIKDSLKPHQLYALDAYKPCIIPPVEKGLIGQADDADIFGKVLERAHFMPKEMYDSRREEIAQRQIDRMKAKVPPGFIIDDKGIKDDILKVMDEARAMPDVDFGLRKAELASGLKSRLVPNRPPANIGVKIERFLLQPEIIPELEKRMK